MTKVIENETPKTVQYYRGFFKKVLHTGSRVVVDKKDWEAHPPKDDDWLCLIDKGNLTQIEDFFIFDGFTRGGSLDPTKVKWEYNLVLDGILPIVADTTKGDSVFTSWKKTTYDEETGLSDTLNIILTWDDHHFDTFEKATKLAKALNLKTKEERVLLFEAINKDIWPDNLGTKPPLPEEVTEKKLTPSEEVLSSASTTLSPLKTFLTNMNMYK